MKEVAENYGAAELRQKELEYQRTVSQQAYNFGNVGVPCIGAAIGQPGHIQETPEQLRERHLNYLREHALRVALEMSRGTAQATDWSSHVTAARTYMTFLLEG